MTLNGVIALIVRYFSEFDSFAGLLRHGGWRQTYIVFHFWPKLTHLAARSLCDSWATCLFKGALDIYVNLRTLNHSFCYCETRSMPPLALQLVQYRGLSASLHRVPIFRVRPTGSDRSSQADKRKTLSDVMLSCHSFQIRVPIWVCEILCDSAR